VGIETKLGNNVTFYRDATGRHLNGSVSPAGFPLTRGMRALIVYAMIVDSLTPCHDGSVFTDQ
jgi:hypothetical protein